MYFQYGQVLISTDTLISLFLCILSYSLFQMSFFYVVSTSEENAVSQQLKPGMDLEVLQVGCQ